MYRAALSLASSTFALFGLCAAMSELPGVVVMDRSDLTEPQVQDKVRELLAGRRADVILRLEPMCLNYL